MDMRSGFRLDDHAKLIAAQFRQAMFRTQRDNAFAKQGLRERSDGKVGHDSCALPGGMRTHISDAIGTPRAFKRFQSIAAPGAALFPDGKRQRIATISRSAFRPGPDEFLIEQKDRYGAWYSTQTTVNVIQALLLLASRETTPSQLPLKILVNGSAQPL